MYPKYRIILTVIISAVIFLTSCINSTITNIDDSLVYNPEFSIPLGYDTLSFEQMEEEILVLDLPIDTAALPDSFPILQYNDFFYYFSDTLSQTFITALDFSNIVNDTYVIKQATIRLNFSNGFPNKIGFKLEFEAQNNLPLFTLFEDDRPLVVEAAELDSEGDVVAPFLLYKYDIPLSEEQISLLSDARYISTTINIYPPSDEVELVKFYPDYDIGFQVGIRIEIEQTIDE